MGKFCKKCGTPINDNTNFCPRCGCNQNEVQPYNQALYSSIGPVRAKSQNKGSDNTNVIIWLLVVVVMAVGIFCIVSASRSGVFSDSPSFDIQQEEEIDVLPPDYYDKSTIINDKSVPHNSGTITATEVRMRDEPNLKSNVIGYFNKGESVDILEIRPNWIKVKRANGAVAWVSSQFCTY